VHAWLAPAAAFPLIIASDERRPIRLIWIELNAWANSIEFAQAFVSVPGASWESRRPEAAMGILCCFQSHSGGGGGGGKYGGGRGDNAAAAASSSSATSSSSASSCRNNGRAERQAGEERSTTGNNNNSVDSNLIALVNELVGESGTYLVNEIPCMRN
jgi:hypothetical protein